MIDINALIAHYQERLKNDPVAFEGGYSDVLVDTITYLEAYKQVHQMLVNLGDAVKGVTGEGD